MTAHRAKVDFDPVAMGLRLALGTDRYHYEWEQPKIKFDEEDGTELGHSAWLRITEDAARAIYEALAEHFGHNLVNARVLRQDYEAERKRVDKLIDNLINKVVP